MPISAYLRPNVHKHGSEILGDKSSFYLLHFSSKLLYGKCLARFTRLTAVIGANLNNYP
jgi:hypothetical protein